MPPALAKGILKVMSLGLSFRMEVVHIRAQPGGSGDSSSDGESELGGTKEGLCLRDAQRKPS
jgi:hypothetical protein